MIPLEHEALDALAKASMRIASNGKRFRNDLIVRRSMAAEANLEYKLTKRQALYLWFLVDMYRRQIKSATLRGIGAERRLTGELPEIYLPGDLAPPVEKKKKAKHDRNLQNMFSGN